MRRWDVSAGVIFDLGGGERNQLAALAEDQTAVSTGKRPFCPITVIYDGWRCVRGPDGCCVVWWAEPGDTYWFAGRRA